MTFNIFWDTVFLPFLDFACMSLIVVLLAANVLIVVLLLVHKRCHNDLFEMSFPKLKIMVIVMAGFIWITTLVSAGFTGTFFTPINNPADYVHLLNTDLPAGVRLLIELGIAVLLAFPAYSANLRLMKQQKQDRVERHDLQNRVKKANSWAHNEGQRNRQIRAELAALRAGEAFIKENSHVSVAVKEEFSRIIRETQKAEEQALVVKDRRR